MRFLIPIVSLFVVVINAATPRRKNATSIRPKLSRSADARLMHVPKVRCNTDGNDLADLDKENESDDSPSESESNVSRTVNDENSSNSNQNLNKFWWESPELTLVDREPFAKGSFGAVYAANANVNGREFKIVIKTISVVKGTKEMHEEAVENAEREYWNHKAVKSPYVVAMLAGHWKPTVSGIRLEAALIMEFGGKFSLVDLYNAGRLFRVNNSAANQFERVRFCAASICEGLKACHRQGILHRDVALKNIVISLDGRIKLCDFGLSCRMNSNGKTSGPVGTPDYASRRVYSGQEYGVDADYYSLGACMFALDQLKAPLGGTADTTQEIINWHRKNGKMRRLLSTFMTDWRVIHAVWLLCDLEAGDEDTVARLALFESFNEIVAPQSVLEDIQKLHSDHEKYNNQ